MIQPETAEIAELLGLPESAAGLSARCPISSIQELLVAVDDRDLLTRGLSLTMLRRRKGCFDENESQRLYRVARAWLMVLRIFGNENKARRFLARPHAMLDGEVAIERAASSVAGIEELEQVLGRLYYGSAA